jgi:hypothetical protein
MSVGTPRECEKLRERLLAHVDGTLTGDDVPRVNEHLAACARCRLERDDLSMMIATLRGIPPGEVSPDLVSRVRRAVHERAPRPQPIQQFWTRLAVPVAVLTGIIAVSFALRPAVQQPRTAGEVGGRAQRAASPAAPLADSPLASGRLSESAPSHRPPERDARELAAARGQGVPPLRVGRPSSAPRGDATQATARAKERARIGDWYDQDSAAGRRGSAAGRRGGAAGRGGGAAGPRDGPSARKDAFGLRDRETLPPAGAGVRRAEGTPAGPSLAPAEQPVASDEWKSESVIEAVESEDGAPPPFSARVVLARGEGRSLLALRVLAEQPVSEIALVIGREGAERQVWRGTPPMPGAVLLSAEEIGPGPTAIPVRVESPQGRRQYTLFLPVMARLGESAAAAPVGRHEGAPFSRVLADFSALTGLVLLAEEPLSARVCGEIPAGEPGESLTKIADDLGYEVRREDDLVLTLERRRSSE